ncbi:hypothetical protein KIPB_009487 [Kipferlia bialata]|uniref:Uncharacterized protein n=1 Tax=Kipferlia bialata TaxID=797122 RepID=A0A9K3GLM4_9EUKA|nr:hypothetical protein KIPB_009487 [Kipferlia bialata]|eukprot:g9487.t1
MHAFQKPEVFVTGHYNRERAELAGQYNLHTCMNVCTGQNMWIPLSTLVPLSARVQPESISFLRSFH